MTGNNAMSGAGCVGYDGFSIARLFGARDLTFGFGLRGNRDDDDIFHLHFLKCDVGTRRVCDRIPRRSNGSGAAIRRSKAMRGRLAARS